MIVDFINGMNSFPMWDFIMFVRWSLILSSFWKLSFSNPMIFLLSSIPTKRCPPEVFRNAVIVFRIDSSIFLSGWFVWRFVRSVDLNSILDVSPILIISCVIIFGSFDFLLGPRISELFSSAFVREVLVSFELPVLIEL